jgi:CRISPR-associated protein Cas6
MYWEQGEDREFVSAGDEVVDVTFRIVCRALPVDHAQPLADAVTRLLPWFLDEPNAGIHSIHVADSGNGWMRPGNADDLVYPSRRTRLALRVPGERVEHAMRLTGQIIDVAGNPLEIGEAAVRPLTTLTTLFARYVVVDDHDDEQTFLANIAAALEGRGIRARKMMCGISKTIRTPGDTIRTRSLMLADLSVADSIRLQQEGLGPHRHLGCGLFIPHKDIKKVRGDDNDTGR